MSDDSFFREVDEELRSDRMKTIWKNYGKYLIGLAILIVLATAGYRGYEYWSSTQAARSGDAFLEALNLAGQGKQEDALAALRDLEETGYGSYGDLARMRAATLLATMKDYRGAIAEYDEIGKDNSIAKAIRDSARIMAGYLLVDHGSYEEVSAQVEVLSGEGNPMRHSAREALGLSAWKAGDYDQANQWFTLIVNDNETPGDIRQRAEVLLNVIAASGHGVTPS